MIAFSVIYFFYLLGMINTTNVESGLFDLEVKLSLLIFPLIFATTNASSLIRERIRYILFAFVAGCLMGCIFFTPALCGCDGEGNPGFICIYWSFMVFSPQLLFNVSDLCHRHHCRLPVCPEE